MTINMYLYHREIMRKMPRNIFRHLKNENWHKNANLGFTRFSYEARRSKTLFMFYKSPNPAKKRRQNFTNKLSSSKNSFCPKKLVQNRIYDFRGQKFWVKTELQYNFEQYEISYPTSWWKLEFGKIICLLTRSGRLWYSPNTVIIKLAVLEPPRPPGVKCFVFCGYRNNNQNIFLHQIS